MSDGTQLKTWVTRDTKERFAAVARHQGLSDSALLKRLVDLMLQTAAGGVDLVINETAYRAFYGWQRLDVAVHFKHLPYQASGYVLDLPPGTLPKGKCLVSLRVLSHDGTSYYQGPTIELMVDG